MTYLHHGTKLHTVLPPTSLESANKESPIPQVKFMTKANNAQAHVSRLYNWCSHTHTKAKRALSTKN